MRRILIVVSALAITASSVVADVPQTINYQGRLTDAGGQPLDTTMSMVFAIYDDSTAPAPRWSETHPAITVEDGLFNVVLGTVVAIDDVLFFGPDRWLGITPGAGPEIQPRTKLVSVPYAFRVSTVDGATGGIVTGDVSIQSDLAVSGKATIGPGHTNSGTSAFVAGENGEASGSYTTVGGGMGNAAIGEYAAVGGGRFNSAEGDYSVIPGGAANTVSASATASMAFGDGVYIDDALRVIFFDGITSGRFGINRDHFDGGINYPIHVGTDASNGNGAHMTAGGVWTNGSSRAFKDRFESLNARVLLDKVAAMPVQAWCFRGSDERHIGPVAEDFVAAFDVGTIRNDDSQRENQYLAASDVAGVSLAAVQALIEEIKELKARVAELEAQDR